MIVQKTSNLFTTVCFCSYNIDWTSFCNDDLDDISNEMAGIYSAILFTITRTSKICLFCEPVDCWDECKFDVELRWILSGEDKNFGILFDRRQKLWYSISILE